jgi:MYXO-CTERM domain-containing protein
MIKTAWAASALAAFTFSAQAATVVQWDFQTPPADLTDSAVSPSVMASIGASTASASGVHASALTDWLTPAGNGSSDSFSSNNWAVGDYWQFSFSTTGYTGLTLNFDQTGSNTGPRDFAVQGSVNGADFFPLTAPYTLINGAWSAATAVATTTFSFDLSGATAVNNSPTLILRLVNSSTTAINGTTVATTGTSRIDNFTVSATPVPEADTAAMLLAGLAALAFVARRRRD